MRTSHDVVHSQCYLIFNQLLGVVRTYCFMGRVVGLDSNGDPITVHVTNINIELSNLCKYNFIFSVEIYEPPVEVDY